MLIRIILLFIIVAVLIWLLKRLFNDDKVEDPTPDELAEPENMKPCQHCGLHIPESAAIVSNSKIYCCQEHADIDNQ